MAEDLGEKTEEPTPRRRQEARDEGNVAKSADAAGALMLFAMIVTLWVGMMPLIGAMRAILEGLLTGDMVSDPLDPGGAGAAIEYAFRGVGGVLMPILIAGWFIAYLSHFWQVGWLIAPKAVTPKPSKINPISGFKRIVSLRSVVKAVLDTLKVVIVVVVAIFSIIQMHSRLAQLPLMSSMQCLGEVGWMMLDVAMRIIAVLLLLGIIDYAYQKWKHSQDLKMTRQEVKDEMKQNEGDPEVKRRRMRMQQQIAMQRVSTAVPQADVIVTNPEHISVAIKYDADNMPAPIVVAKGADFLAMRIRQIAMQNDVPIVERKPLARALYAEVKVGQEVPPEHYKAVAEILAYVYRLSGRMAG